MLRFVINLDSSTERMDLISKRLNELKIPFERVPAVNGRALSDKLISQITYPNNHFDSRVRFPRTLTKGEVGCFLSHRKCWEKLLESNEEWALIMEDDIRISDSAPKFMLSADWIPSGVKIVQLSWSVPIQNGRIRNEVIPIDNIVNLVAPLYPEPLGSQCYIVSREFAKVALSLSEKLAAPVDMILFSPYFELANTFTVWRTAPTLVIANEEIESDIGQRTQKAVEKAPFLIRHGLTRILLRRTVKHYQSQGKEFTFTFLE